MKDQMPLSWQVGDITIHRVLEGVLPPETGRWLLPDATAELVAGVDWLREPWTDDDMALRLASQSFLIEADDRRILVDAGIGNGKQRDNPAWHQMRSDFLERLHHTGNTEDQVDTVVLTHLHTDHVGWCTHEVDGQWAPTFAHARHVVTRAEWDFWAGRELEPPRQQMFDDSVVPVHDAGLIDVVDPRAGVHHVTDGVTLSPSPGHTPGHVTVRVRSRGETAVITGDAVHHPVQVAVPEITSCVDIEPAQAVRSRRELLDEAVRDGHLVLGTHFPGPVAVHLERVGDDVVTTAAQPVPARPAPPAPR